MKMNKLGPGAYALLGGFFVTNIGNGAYAIAVGVMIQQVTGSVLGYFLVIASEFIFKVLSQGVSLFDNLSPTRTAALFDVARAISMITAAIMIGNGYWFFGITLSTLAINLVKPFYIAATFRLVAGMLPPTSYDRYNVSFLAVKQGGYLLGVVGYGLASAWVGLTAVLVFNAVTFAFMSTIMWWLAHGTADMVEGPQRRRSLFGGWRQSLSLVRNRRLRVQVLLSSHDAVMMSIVPIYVLATATNSHSAFGGRFALLQGALLFGSVAAVGCLRVVSPPARAWWAPLAMISLEAVAVLLCALGAGIWNEVVGLLLLGAASGVSGSLMLSDLMSMAASADRGRVANLQMLVIAVLTLTAGGLVGFLSDIEPALGLAVPTVLCLAYIVLLVRRRGLDATPESVSFT